MEQQRCSNCLKWSKLPHYNCLDPNCEIKYCKYCLERFYYSFMHIPTIFGNYLNNRKKCNCGKNFNREFFAKRNFNIDRKYVIELSKINRGISINYREDKIYRNNHINSLYVNYN